MPHFFTNFHLSPIQLTLLNKPLKIILSSNALKHPIAGAFIINAFIAFDVL